MKLTTDGGTTFIIDGDEVTITRSDQPECTIPLADLREFLELLDEEIDE